MQIRCPNIQCTSISLSNNRKSYCKKRGFFYRRSDRKRVQRYFCTCCKKHFSSATSSKNYRQKKRQLNHVIAQLLVRGVSQREIGRHLKINRNTVVRKFIFMAKQAELEFNSLNRKLPLITQMQFDDMETFEHTKCKPLSITLAVQEKTRRILGFEVAQMPAKGLLVHIARKKYGPRADHRPQAREKLFTILKSLVSSTATIKSDENPHYPPIVRRFFPKAEYKMYKGRRGAIVGQGELKKVGFDPIFSLNHTCASIRARANRLFRRTWCTTKKPERLRLHLFLVALHHNRQLKL